MNEIRARRWRPAIPLGHAAAVMPQFEVGSSVSSYSSRSTWSSSTAASCGAVGAGVHLGLHKDYDFRACLGCSSSFIGRCSVASTSSATWCPQRAPVRLLGAGLNIWLLALVLGGLAQWLAGNPATFYFFLFARALSGVGERPSSASSAVRRGLHAGTPRGRSAGVFFTAIPAGWRSAWYGAAVASSISWGWAYLLEVVMAAPLVALSFWLPPAELLVARRAAAAPRPSTPLLDRRARGGGGGIASSSAPSTTERRRREPAGGTAAADGVGQLVAAARRRSHARRPRLRRVHVHHARSRRWPALPPRPRRLPPSSRRRPRSDHPNPRRRRPARRSAGGSPTASPTAAAWRRRRRRPAAFGGGGGAAAACGRARAGGVDHARDRSGDGGVVAAPSPPTRSRRALSDPARPRHPPRLRHLRRYARVMLPSRPADARVRDRDRDALLHLFGDVPSPVVVGALKDAIAELLARAQLRQRDRPRLGRRRRRLRRPRRPRRPLRDAAAHDAVDAVDRRPVGRLHRRPPLPEAAAAPRSTSRDKSKT